MIGTDERIRAMGRIGYPGVGVPGWIGRHPGFDALVVDTAPGDMIVALSGNVPAPWPASGFVVCLVPDGAVQMTCNYLPVPGPGNERMIQLQIRNVGGALVDNVGMSVIVMDVPPQT